MGSYFSDAVKLIFGPSAGAFGRFRNNPQALFNALPPIRINVRDSIIHILADPNITDNIARAMIGATLLEELDLTDEEMEVIKDIEPDIVDDALNDNDVPVNDVIERLEQQIVDLSIEINDLAGELNRQTEEANQQIESRIDNVVGVINDNILPAIDKTDGVISNSFNRINDGFARQNSILDSILDFVSGQIAVTVQNNIEFDDAILGNVTDAISDIVSSENRSQQTILDTVSDLISNTIGDLIDAELGQADQQTRALLSIVEAILFTKESNAESLRNLDGLTGEETGFNWGLGIFKSWFDGEVDGIRVSEGWTDQFSEDLLLNCDDPAKLEEWIDRQGLVSNVAGSIAWSIVKAVGVGMGLLQIAGAEGQRRLAEYSLCHPWQVLTPGDAAAAMQRGAISIEEAEFDIRANGYDNDRTRALLTTAFTIPELGALYSLNLRGFIDGPEFIAKIKALGFNEEDAERLAELKFFIPPPQDLITMAVREVFNPEVAERFGQFEDFPEEFEKWAGQQGISRDWAERYWAAHWGLPSVQMAFEMLHRQVINDADMDTLLKAQDVMPFWRDRLKAISFRPFTRVDVRRMHDMGILDDEQTKRAYMDLGYDEEKAQAMLDFTIEFNRPDVQLASDELDGATRATVINFYEDGVIDEQRARDLLADTGIGKEAAELFIDNANLQIQRQERKQVIDLTLDRLRNRTITGEVAKQEISAIGLTTTEEEKIASDIDGIVARNRTLPAKADLNKFLAANLISSDDYIDVMMARGYSQQWSERYLQLAQQG